MQSKPKGKKGGSRTITKRVSLKTKDPEPTTRPLKSSASSSSVNKTGRKLIKSKTNAPCKTENSDDENDSIDSIHFKEQTESVKAQVLESLKIFKIATEEYILQNRDLEKEVENFEAEFEQVKTEVSEILMESSKSKLDLLEIKKKILETPERVETSSKKHIFQDESMNLETSFREEKSPDMLKEKIELLKREMCEIKENLMSNEEEIKESDAENTELRNITFKIKENLYAEPLALEYSDEKVACQSCVVA